jgi:hypothetical protein
MFKLLLKFFFLATLPLLNYSCNSIEGNFNLPAGVDNSVQFAGVASLSEVTDSSLKLSWNPHASAVAYDIFFLSQNKFVYLTTVVGQSANSITLENLAPGSNLSFRVNLKTAEGKYDGNQTTLSATLKAAPDIPSGLSLLTPLVSPSLDATPTFRVNGVKKGDTIKLFTDNTCSNEVASAVASGTSIELTASELPVGSYSFYATATNSQSVSSPCSSVLITYVRNSCSSNYLMVPPNQAVGTTSDFCIAKYEMKNVAGTATSEMAGTPWVSLTMIDAKNACSALGSRFHLITNPEWMTVARNIELVGSNWSSGMSGVGVIARGHSDDNPSVALAAAADNDPYYMTGNSALDAPNSGWEQKRTLELSNGEIIWDFSANVWEIIDWEVPYTQKAYVSSDGGPVTTWREFSSIDVNSGGGDTMNPETWQPFYSLLSSNEGLGQYYSGDGDTVVRRGENWDGGSIAGPYTLMISWKVTSVSNAAGFRCVEKY